ncbi:hypothetical protein Pmani_032336 [Petrolisthes manimaculis]|uniref:ADP-ribosylation factor n=1 Tax=Petrolisthes manimaculis TaxID=1843537 RepID=A0AAE1NTW5_9EUCA|nr:hypothetical protein Pmani_032336 [Petrolisthes manimaculis]
MGLIVSRILALVQSKKPCRILMVGLDAAGKTTILYQLKLGQVVSTIPTLGFNVETVEYKNISFTVWDVGGQERLRPLWRHYYSNTSALIYVVDSNDPERLVEAREELHLVLENDEIQNCPLLVIANKTDLPMAVSVEELTDKMGLRHLNRPWCVQPTCAIKSQGLYEGLDWLAAKLC